jgi:hypothetical protein
MPPQATLIKRECFKGVGMFNERFRALEDWELFLRMSKYYQFKFIDEPLVILYRQPDSIKANQSALIKASKQILKAFFDDFEKDKTVLARRYFSLGHLLCSNGKLSEGRDYFVRSVKAYQLDIRVFSAFLVSLLGKSVYNMVANSYREIMKPF